MFAVTMHLPDETEPEIICRHETEYQARQCLFEILILKAPKEFDGVIYSVKEVAPITH